MKNNVSVISMPAREMFEGRSSKYEQFEQILDNLPLSIGKDYWVAGGLLRRVLTNQPLEEGDIDIFIKQEIAPNSVIKSFEACGWRQTDEQRLSHAVNMRRKIGKTEFDLQIILLNLFQDIPACLDSFDFTICQIAFDGVNIWTTPQCLVDNGNRKLGVHHITYPVASLRRLVKYSNQGYYPCNGCLLALAEAIHKLPPDHYFTALNTTYID